MTLDASRFETLADETLEDLMERIEDQLGDEMDVELQGGILTLELDSGGQYVINKHAPMQQIWMSSPKSGATHFAWDADGECWLSTRGGESLEAMLTAELGLAD